MRWRWRCVRQQAPRLDLLPLCRACVCAWQIETRFPMFGGWKTQWYQGYNLPASRFISQSGDEYTLSIDLGVPFDHVVTDKISVRSSGCSCPMRACMLCMCVCMGVPQPAALWGSGGVLWAIAGGWVLCPCRLPGRVVVWSVQVRVILPEGASVVSVKSPIDITVLPEERRFTYLDTPLTGRTVVTLTAQNLVDQSNGKLTVRSHGCLWRGIQCVAPPSTRFKHCPVLPWCVTSGRVQGAAHVHAAGAADAGVCVLRCLLLVHPAVAS